MSGYDASVEELHATGFRLGQVADDLQDGAARLRSQLDGLLGGDWRGGAADGFAAGWAQWQSGFAEAVSALATMGNLLGATGNVYETNEGDSSALVISSGAGLT